MAKDREKHLPNEGRSRMKTLEEVITIMDVIDQTCTCCAYQHDCDETECVEKTALHYLKEYREKHDDILRMEEALGYCEIMANPPLTWDELKQMEGKPVWVEWISGTWKGLRKWVISHGCDDLMMVFTALDVAGASYDGHLRQINLGKTWQAYRKERP